MTILPLLGSPPRVRGLLHLISHSITPLGSPPRVRGLPRRLSSRRLSSGITPRVCGDYLARSTAELLVLGSPRVCGDYQTSISRPRARMGSPPRVRGLPRLTTRHSATPRITPACAGTTTGPAPRPTEAWDHPRVCGDYGTHLPTTPAPRGSPPRVRGLLYPSGRNTVEIGITPACAGTTHQQQPGNRQRWDHPRVCGDYESLKCWGIMATGSPPRVRGLPRLTTRHSATPRITPACAGTTPTCPTVRQLARDHPRVCGDYIATCCSPNGQVGSPPRVRGLLCGNSQWQWSGRITPACAGTTILRCIICSIGWDHPRVCGDYYATEISQMAETGSPPRVRGLPRRAGNEQVGLGITPACVGTTWTTAIEPIKG